MHTKTISNKDHTKESYEATAQEFARNVIDLAPRSSIEKFIKLLPPNAKIIDIGCGSGRDAKIFTGMGAEVLGIDFCVNLIDIAKKYAPLAKFQLMDIETMTLPSCSFDGAWAACSLGHISKAGIPDVLKKIHHFLKDDGYFYLALKMGSGEMMMQDLRYDGNIEKFWSFFEADELKNLLQEARFKIRNFDIIEPSHAYQTHPAMRVFCQKI